MNNSRRIVELLTKSADLMTALRQREKQTLWQRLHNGIGRNAQAKVRPNAPRHRSITI